jgi:ParB-like chromosome segregation protein Spo0J
MKIGEIRIGDRGREVLGDLRALADSIGSVGLLHPVVVTKGGDLIAGQRRIEAAKTLGWEDIQVTVAANLTEAMPMLLAERDENICRKDLSDYEAAKLRDRLMEIEKPAAAARASAGRKKGGKNKKGRTDKKCSGGSSAQAKRSTRASERAAKAAGRSEKTLRKVEQIKTLVKEHPSLRRFLKDLISGGKAERILKAIKKAIREEQDKNARALLPPDRCDIRCCTMEQLLSTVKDLDAIITDPPYGEKFLPLYEDLARLAKGALKPGGILAVMCGQSYLPEILARMGPLIKYRWTAAYLTPGGQAVQLWKRKVNTFWKPILLFGGEPFWIGDVWTSSPNDNDKDHHEWGQSESGMSEIISALTRVGDLVCDPFLGGGTTASVAMKMDRRFIGCDSSEVAISETRARL